MDVVHGSQLWVSDGTTNGTQRVTDINPGRFAGIDPRYLKVFNGHLFFGASDGAGGSGTVGERWDHRRHRPAQ